MAYLYKPAGSAHYISSKIFFILFNFCFYSFLVHPKSYLVLVLLMQFKLWKIKSFVLIFISNSGEFTCFQSTPFLEMMHYIGKLTQNTSK